MSTYPAALDNFDSDHADEPNRLVGPDLDAIAAAVNNIEAELGTDPAGAAATVVARLTAGEALSAAELEDAVDVLEAAIALKQDSATAATDAELTAVVATLTAAIAAKQDAATAATDAELAAGLASKADLVGGVVPSSQIPALALTDVVVVASQVAQLALTAQEGDVAVRSDESKSYVHNGGTAATMADWTLLQTPTDAVLSVNGDTGVVVLGYADVGAAGVADARLSDQRVPTDASVTAAKVAGSLKPSGSAVAADEALRALGATASTAAAGNDARLSDQRTPSDASVTNAKLANDLALPGNPTAATQAAGNSSTRIATTAYVMAESGLLVPKSVVNAAGDLLVGSADDTVTRLPAPTTTGHVLTADTGEALKMEWVAPAGGGNSLVVLGADVTNANAVANTLEDITGLAFAMVANTRYWFRFVIDYAAVNATVGSRWAVNGPASPTRVSTASRWANSQSADAARFDSAYDGGGASTGGSPATAALCVMEGIIHNGANAGNLIGRFASEVASNAVTAKAGSVVEYRVLA